MHNWHHHNWHRGPSRLIWFVFGAAAATAFIRHREAEGFAVRHCSRHRIPQDAYPPPGQEQKVVDAWRWNANASFPKYPAQPPAAATAAPAESAPAHVPMQKPADGQWDEEKQRLQRISEQATETLTSLSEAGLDSLLSTVESLKAKIAERRAQREREVQEAQAARDEKFRQFEEWKKQQEAQEAARKPRHIV
ncbi:hypothetical protein PHLCEN_2v8636 [Hermanssonia centrifuga]|uniref:Uncharacterized protein n=1 Tax=Hermanssonia centrifuga TaxID=98765 RepID=A0A2R6NT18_9APHY|nr:hypothetical protein PHLCEN_2v8636 [Hermanssonia centrifuga]